MTIDPRSPGGAISSNAVAYAGPITLQSNTPIVVRAVNPDKRQTTIALAGFAAAHG